jgi:hypothetical protein
VTSGTLWQLVGRQRVIISAFAIEELIIIPLANQNERLIVFLGALLSPSIAEDGTVADGFSTIVLGALGSAFASAAPGAA